MEHDSLIETIVAGDYDSALAQLANHSALDTFDDQGRNALIAAAESGHVALLTAVLDAGAAIDARDQGDPAQLEFFKKNRELLDADNPERDERFLEDSLKEKPRLGRTALATAVRHRHEAAAQLLVERGADRALRDHLRMSPLGLAVKTRQPNMIRLLVSGHGDAIAPLPIDPDTLEDAFFHDQEILEALHHGACDNRALEVQLVHAAALLDETKVRLLLDRGVSANARTSLNQTALIQAIDSSLLSGLRWGKHARAKWGTDEIALRTRVIEALLAAGADSGLSGAGGTNALMEAIDAGLTLPTLEAIRSASVDLDELDSMGNSALARSVELSRAVAARWLLDAGASVATLTTLQTLVCERLRETSPAEDTCLGPAGIGGIQAFTQRIYKRSPDWGLVAAQVPPARMRDALVAQLGGPASENIGDSEITPPGLFVLHGIDQRWTLAVVNAGVLDSDIASRVESLAIQLSGALETQVMYSWAHSETTRVAHGLAEDDALAQAWVDEDWELDDEDIDEPEEYFEDASVQAYFLVHGVNVPALMVEGTTKQRLVLDESQSSHWCVDYITGNAG